jgi:hypothetical protein
MAEQLFWYNTVTVTAAATPLSIYDLVTDADLDYALSKNLPGQCVSLNFISDVAIKVGGTAAELDDTHGGTLAADTVFQDSATGAGGNAIPLGQIYLYATTSGGTATVTVYLRFIG